MGLHTDPTELGLRLHHIGVASADADADAAWWEDRGFERASALVHDPIQRVRVLFLSAGPEDAPMVELVEPASDDAPVRRYLAKGQRFYHLCFETYDMAAALRHLREHRWLVIQEPVPAEAFGGRSIAWCYSPARDLVELVEAPPRASSTAES